MLDQLIAQGRLSLIPGALAALGAPPLLGIVPFDCVEGMLLGLAIGDSLGNTTKGELPHRRHSVRDYKPSRYAGGCAVGHLLGRTTEDDDRVFELIAQARARWS